MKKLSLLVLSSFFVASQAFAVPVGIGDFSSEAITINFDTTPGGTPIPGITVPPYSGAIAPASVIDDQYSSLGVLFSSLDGGVVAVDDQTSQIAGISSPNAIVGTIDANRFSTGGPIFVDFIDPVTGLPTTTTRVGAFSIDVDIEPVAFTVFDLLGNELETTFFETGGNGSIDFAGIYRAEGIASVAINVPRTDFFALDDFIFEPVARQSVPAPGVIGLLLMGLAGMGFAARRKSSGIICGT